MLNKIEVMQMANAMASHAALRQGAVSQNIANADTPNYRAQDVAPFEDLYEEASGGEMRATRAGHFGAQSATTFAVETTATEGTLSPNGNNVSLEDEMVRGVEVRREHDRALAIYKNSLNILRASLGR